MNENELDTPLRVKDVVVARDARSSTLFPDQQMTVVKVGRRWATLAGEGPQIVVDRHTGYENSGRYNPRLRAAPVQEWAAWDRAHALRSRLRKITSRHVLWYDQLDAGQAEAVLAILTDAGLGTGEG